METAVDIDVRPFTRPKKVPLLFDAEYTGETVEWKGKSIYVGRMMDCMLTDGGRWYLVSVDGGRVRWAPEEWVVGWFTAQE